MSNVKVKVTMRNGSGLGLFIRINDHNLYFNRSGIQELQLTPQYYIATVTGNEPSSANTTIEIIQDESMLTSENYSSPTFWGFLPFTVK